MAIPGLMDDVFVAGAFAPEADDGLVEVPVSVEGVAGLVLGVEAPAP
ncbi:hypothetical protein [Citreicoccus inhibens]|nr:hypothetical protein [Citreicoccus inhibens]